MSEYQYYEFVALEMWSLYLSQARYIEAEVIFKKSLAISQRLLQSVYRDVVESLASLGGLICTRFGTLWRSLCYKPSVGKNLSAGIL